MEFIEKLITQNENDHLTKYPDEEEIHNTVLGMDSNSSPCVDGFGRIFFRRVTEDFHSFEALFLVILDCFSLKLVLLMWFS